MSNLFQNIWKCFYFFLFFFKFYFIFKLHITVLVLPNIDMNPPQVYMCESVFKIYFFSLLKLVHTWLATASIFFPTRSLFWQQGTKFETIMCCFFITFLPVCLFAWNPSIWRNWSVRNWNATSETYSVQFSCSVVSDSLQPHGLQHTRLPCPSLPPGACSNSCPLLVMPSNHLTS